MCSLTVLRLVSIGAYLEWSNEEGILLPLRYLPEGLREGDRCSVFVYHDNEGRLIATTLLPYVQVGQVARLRCRSVSASGAFMDWGIHRDLFVPFAEQQSKMQEGSYYFVYAYIDHISERIVGSAKLSKHLGNSLANYHSGQEVVALIIETNDIGYRAVVDNRFWGLLYFNSLPEKSLVIGQTYPAYVVRTRDDGKIDLSLGMVGYARTEGNAQKLLQLLQANKGLLPVGDKSNAEEIEAQTGLSKKSFKMAVGKLYKEHRLSLSPKQIKLIK